MGVFNNIGRGRGGCNLLIWGVFLVLANKSVFSITCILSYFVCNMDPNNDNYGLNMGSKMVFFMWVSFNPLAPGRP
jgi:hypothetical protein